MTVLDDDIDAVLRSFRADEAHIDDPLRARIWDRIADEVPDAASTLDALDPPGVVRSLRGRLEGTGHRARLLSVAAAVLALLAVGALAVRSGPADDAVTAGPSVTSLPDDLQELADAVAVRSVPVLGSSPDTAYTYRRVERGTQAASGTQQQFTRTESQWVDGAGTGRTTNDSTGFVQVANEPGSYALGPFPPEVAVGLPDDVDAVAAAVDAQFGAGAFGVDATPGLVEVLSWTGLPGPARAGILRSLDRLGFDPVPAPAVGPNLLRVEGSGPEGSTMQADLDLQTGHVVAWERLPAEGGRRSWTVIEVDLRGDTRGP